MSEFEQVAHGKEISCALSACVQIRDHKHSLAESSVTMVTNDTMMPLGQQITTNSNEKPGKSKLQRPTNRNI